MEKGRAGFRCPARKVLDIDPSRPDDMSAATVSYLNEHNHPKPKLPRKGSDNAGGRSGAAALTGVPSAGGSGAGDSMHRPGQGTEISSPPGAVSSGSGNAAQGEQQMTASPGMGRGHSGNKWGPISNSPRTARHDHGGDGGGNHHNSDGWNLGQEGDGARKVVPLAVGFQFASVPQVESHPGGTTGKVSDLRLFGQVTPHRSESFKREAQSIGHSDHHDVGAGSSTIRIPGQGREASRKGHGTAPGGGGGDDVLSLSLSLGGSSSSGGGNRHSSGQGERRWSREEKEKGSRGFDLSVPAKEDSRKANLNRPVGGKRGREEREVGRGLGMYRIRACFLAVQI